MPAYACAILCSKETKDTVETALYARSFFAVSIEEALGKALLHAKKDKPSIQGWEHHVAAMGIPTEWLETIVNYEKRISSERSSAEKAKSEGDKKEGDGSGAGTVQVSSSVEQGQSS